MNDVVNNKKGHNIVNDKTAALLISQTAYLLKKETKTLARNLKNNAGIYMYGKEDRWVV